MYICDSDSDSATNITDDTKPHDDSCHLLLGPIIKKNKIKKSIYNLDYFKNQFSLVFFNDKFEQFGDAEFEIFSIDIFDEFNQKLC